MLDILPYQSFCGAAIAVYGGKTCHIGEAKIRHRYSPWSIFNNTGYTYGEEKGKQSRGIPVERSGAVARRYGMAESGAVSLSGR
ncbi:hypothetical protein A2U01_0055569, partial [Trifolium medium]|nr:hypothetical protein [Trifolium medium]